MENDEMSSGGRLLIKMASLIIKPSQPPQGAKGKPYSRASPAGNASPLLVLRTTFPSASGGTIGTIRTSCRTRHSERSEESRYMVQMRGLVINTHSAGRWAPAHQKAPLMIKPSKPPQGRGGNHTAGLRPWEMLPPLVLRTTFPPASGGTIKILLSFRPERSEVEKSPSTMLPRSNDSTA